MKLRKLKEARAKASDIQLLYTLGKDIMLDQ